MRHTPYPQQFQPTPSSRRETFGIPISVSNIFYFNPLPPRGGRQNFFVEDSRGGTISTHSLLAEGDHHHGDQGGHADHFNPLPPRGGRRRAGQQKHRGKPFQPTPSSRRETRPFPRRGRDGEDFNPLPPRGGRHEQAGRARRDRRDFNPLPPRGGRRFRAFRPARAAVFQPTPSSRRETRGPGADARGRIRHFNPLPPRGGRRQPRRRHRRPRHISTHSLLAEGDLDNHNREDAKMAFQPTPSSRRETVDGEQVALPLEISTHSLLAEGDADLDAPLPHKRHFNPLPPRGGRLYIRIPA